MIINNDKKTVTFTLGESREAFNQPARQFKENLARILKIDVDTFRITDVSDVPEALAVVNVRVEGLSMESINTLETNMALYRASRPKPTIQ